MQTEPDQGFDHIGSPSPPPTTVTPNDRLSPTFEQWIHSARKGRRNAVANILNDGYTPRITTDLSMGIEKLSCSVCIQSVIGKTNCFTCDASSKCTHCRQRGTFQFRPFSSSAYRFICHLAMLRSLLGRTLTIDYISNHFGRYFASKQSQVTMINNNEPESSFKPRKALVLSKFSRYELEKRRFPHLSEEELSMKLEKRGSDYQGLIHHHNIHSASKNKLKSVLESRGIEVKFINRFEYNRAVIDWADVIFTTGGDGTFLAAASLIKSPNKTVIGINSDPSRSVGYLCLPQPYSSDLDATLDKLCSGQFKWLFRQRIRITLQGENALDDPLELHKQQLNCGSDYLGSGEVEEIKEFPTSPEAKNIPEGSWRSCQLPVRALNEVFVGENHSARVSYCELTVDDRPRVKFRSSGVAVCTGTGSTSWSFNISRIPKQTVQSILEIAKAKNGDNSKLQDSFVDDVTKEFNDSLVFEPEKLAMAYTIRDPQILDDNFLPSRAFAQRIEIKSRMDDACVVIDGGLSYRFNDGNIACFEMKEEDALRTVNII